MPQGSPQRLPGLLRPVWRVVAFDLDETTGSWGRGSLAYQIFTKFSGDTTALVQPFVQLYMARGGARPWLRELLQCLAHWKRSGRIDEVAIFTAASNRDGWVSFLGHCMEVYAGTLGLFGRTLSREDCPLVVGADGIRTMKDLARLSGEASHVVLLDDKPQHAQNGYVIGVAEYCQDVAVGDLVDWMINELPCDAELIHTVFRQDSVKHPPSASDFSADTAFKDCSRVLDAVFPEAAKDVYQAGVAVAEMLMASA